MFSTSISTGTASVLLRTSDASDLMRRLSALGFSMPSTSMADTPRWSRSLAISSFSLNDSDRSFMLAALRMVTSLIRTSLMMLLAFLFTVE